jgi:hypothetical protein
LSFPFVVVDYTLVVEDIRCSLVFDLDNLGFEVDILDFKLGSYSAYYLFEHLQNYQ